MVLQITTFTHWRIQSLGSPMSLGSEVKSLTGTGIILVIYSQMTSILYFSWAEIGMIGAPSATVPAGRREGGRDGRVREVEGGERWREVGREEE